MTHDPIEELLGAYALNAVDDDERAAVEAHLLSCPRCRAEVDSHREVASHLALGGAPAPGGLWERIAGAIEGETPPPLRLVVDDGPARIGSKRTARSDRPRWQRVGLTVLAAAAAVAVLAVAVSSLARVRHLEDDRSIETAALEAIASPDARVADLLDDDGAVLVRAAVLPDGTSYLFADNLPELDDRIYQLWGAAGDQVVSLGPMGSAPTVLPFHADETMTAFMITVEDEPVESSTNPPIALGALA
jgi:anti-sigma factor RsiW